MYKKIAVAGKGGTGKTSLTGLLIDYLVKEGKKPILAVDADANSNLNEVLGIEVEQDIGSIREEATSAASRGVELPGGMTNSEYLKYKLASIVSEGDDGYDMLVMGRTEGEGCYCFVNSILKRQIQDLSVNYKHVVIDNEAGMEHISRGTVGKMDLLLLISDYSRRSIQAVGRIKVLAEDLKLNIPKIGLIVNKAPNGELSDSVMEEIRNQNLDLLGVVPLDPTITEYDAEGKPLVEMPDDSISKKALKDILYKLELI